MGTIFRVFLFVTLMAGFLAIVKGQCDGSAKIISGGTGDEESPNLLVSEYGKSANCSWIFNPPSGADYALLMTVQKLWLSVVKNGGRHCLGSYNLSIDGAQLRCDRYANHVIDGQTVIDTTFCKAYYQSPSCSNISEIRECEDPQKTSYPVTMSYYSDGRTDPDIESHNMYFSIAYKFIECPKDSMDTVVGTSPTAGTPIGVNTATTFSTENTEIANGGATTDPSSSTTSTLSTNSSANSERTRTRATTATLLDTEAFPTSTSTVTIALIAVIVFLLVGGIIGGIYFYRRLKTPASGRSQRPQPISRNSPGEKDDVHQPPNAIPDVAFHNYENIQPSVLIETPGYEVPQPIRMPEEDEGGYAIPDGSFHNYEDIQPPALIETPGYETPQPIGMSKEDEGGYVVPGILQQGESSREPEYEEAFQHLKPEPDYVEPETVRKEPNRRLIAKFKIPQ